MRLGLSAASSTRFARPTGFARWAVLASIVLVPGAAGVGHWLGSGPPIRSSSSSPLVPDTVTVFGPRTFATPTGRLAYYVKRFGLTVEPGKRYVLTVVNGQPDRSGRVTSGSVTLNAAEIVSAADLAAGGRAWRRIIQRIESNILVVDAEGPAGARLTVAVQTTA